MFNEILLCLMIRKKIKNEQVLDFLEKNPDFFVNNPNALEKINFPLKNNAEYNDKSKVVPFKDWIIENLKDVQKNIIENAHHNFLTQQKIHESVIEILRIDNVKDVFVFFRSFQTNSAKNPWIFNEKQKIQIISISKHLGLIAFHYISLMH